jgi:hypothetical protein
MALFRAWRSMAVARGCTYCKDDKEVGGSVFPVAQDEAAGIVWWNKLICSCVRDCFFNLGI